MGLVMAKTPVEVKGKSSVLGIDDAGGMAQGAQNGIVKLFGLLDIVGPEHNVTEHEAGSRWYEKQPLL